MLHGHELVLHGLRLLLRLDQRRVHRLGDVDLVRLPAGARHLRNPGDLPLAGVHHAVGVHLHLLQHLGDQAALLLDQRKKQVLLVDLHILVANRDFLCIPHGFKRLLRIFLCVHTVSPFPGTWSKVIFDFL